MTDRLLKFLFKAAPVRGGLVRMEDAWRQMVALHDFPPVVTRLLGEMVAAGALLATSIKFNGALVMQVHGDGPVKLLVVECLPDLAIRATATLADAPIADDASMRDLINRHGRGRFAITLDPRDPMPGQQPYQGIVPLDGETMAEVLQMYMRQSEQLDTRLWLAATEHVSAGLLLQSLPTEGGTTGSSAQSSDPDAWDRAVTLAHTITSEELLTLGADDVLRRLFWQEPLEHYPAMQPALRVHVLARTDRADARFARARGSRLDHRRAGHGDGDLRFLQPPVHVRRGRHGAVVHQRQRRAAGRSDAPLSDAPSGPSRARAITAPDPGPLRGTAPDPAGF